MNAVPQAPPTPEPYSPAQHVGVPYAPMDHEAEAALVASYEKGKRFVLATYIGAVALGGVVVATATGMAGEVASNIGDRIHVAADTIGAHVGNLLDSVHAISSNGAQAAQPYMERIVHLPAPALIALGIAALSAAFTYGHKLHKETDRPAPVLTQSRGRVPIMPSDFNLPRARSMATQLASPVRAQQGCPTQPDANLASQDNPRRTVQLPIAP